MSWGNPFGNCDYKGCKRNAVATSIIFDEEGNDYHRVLCKFHIKKICWDEIKKEEVD